METFLLAMMLHQHKENLLLKDQLDMLMSKRDE
jgi:hypothetical protein